MDLSRHDVCDVAGWYRKNHPKPLASIDLFRRFLARVDSEDLEDLIIATTFGKLDK